MLRHEAAAPAWQRVEALCQEYLGAHPAGDGPPGDGASVEAGADAAGPDGQGDGLGPGPLPGRPLTGPLGDFFDEPLGEPVRRWLASARAWLEEETARWSFLAPAEPVPAPPLGLWRDLRFASFTHYAEERLGLSGRAVEQRAWLERRLHELPALRHAAGTWIGPGECLLRVIDHFLATTSTASTAAGCG